MRRLAVVLCLAGVSVLGAGVLSQSPPRLLADLETTPRPPRSSEPERFARVGAWTWFTADDGVHGRELFRTTGSSRNTGLVVDLRAGAEGSDPLGLTPVGARLLFFANDGVHGFEPWVSDGTAAGTWSLGDLAPGTLGSSTEAFGVGRRAVFVADDGSTRRVYGTDGTAAGTAVVLELGAVGAPEEVSLARSAVVDDPVVGPVRYFPTRTGSSIVIWRTDGTPAGTTQVVSHATWSGSSLSQVALLSGDGFALLQLRLASLVDELWSVDGAGAVRLAAYSWYRSAVDAWSFDGWTWVGFAIPPGGGSALVRTDGTPAGTVDVPVGAGFEVVQFLGEIGDSLWMLGQVDRSTTALLRLDRGASQPIVTASLSLPQISTRPRWIRVGTRFLFGAEDAVWALDPRAASIDRLADAGGRSGSWLGEGIGRAFFGIDDPALGTELGTSDGTPAGTGLVADLNSLPSGNLGSEPRLFTSFGSRAAFATERSDRRYDLWVTDGSERGTLRVFSDLGYVRPMAVVGDRLFFHGGEPHQLPGLFVTDGTVAGSWRVDTPGGPGLHANPAPIPLGDEVIGFDGAQVVASDGNAIRVVAPLPSASVMPKSARLGEQVFFELDEGAGPASGEVLAGLWVTDGTQAGTRRVARHSAFYGGNGVDYTGLVAALDRVFYTVYPSQPPFELWSSDGTAAGTRRVAVLSETRTYERLRIVASGDRVFVSWNGRLWSSDGSPAGTRRLAEQTIPDSVLVPFAGGLLFEAVDVASGRIAVWRHDGGAGGPTRIGTGYDRRAWRTTEIATDGHRRAYFVARDVLAGDSPMWVTDGTAGGTRRLEGPVVRGSSYFPRYAAAGGVLIVAAEDPALGVEPHVIDLGGTAQRLSPGCGGRGREASLEVSVHGTPHGGFELLGRSSAGRVAAVLISAPPRVPISFPAGGRCWFDLDLNSAVELVSLPIAAGRFTHAVPLPDDPALHGIQAVLQALVGPTDAPLALDLTNGVLLTLGP